MAIIRGGDAEYAENQPSLEEKSEKLAQSVDAALKQDSSTLKLNGQYLSTDEIIIISGFERIQSVRSLDLSDNQIGEPALKVLFQSPMLKDLQELYLGINFLTDAGILEISRFPITLSNLKVLSLSDNRITDAAGSELVKSENFPQLDFLDLGWNEIGNGTAKALGETQTLPNLKKLDLERGYINHEGIVEFVKGTLAGGLEEINLSSNKLDNEAAKTLASASCFSALKILRLSHNLIADEGARAIGESTSLSGLTHLFFGRNYFGPEGAKHVYETKTLTNLKTLVLQEGVETTPGLVNYSRPELLRPDGE